jgi:hypothetical protein
VSGRTTRSGAWTYCQAQGLGYGCTLSIQARSGVGSPLSSCASIRCCDSSTCVEKVCPHIWQVAISSSPRCSSTSVIQSSSESVSVDTFPGWRRLISSEPLVLIRPPLDRKNADVIGDSHITGVLRASRRLQHLLPRLPRPVGSNRRLDVLLLLRRRKHSRQPEGVEPQLARPSHCVVQVLVLFLAHT